MKNHTVMGRSFETDDNLNLINEKGESLPYPLKECYLKMDSKEGLSLFDNIRDDDFVAFHGITTIGISGKTVHQDYILIRNGRVAEIRRPHEGMMYD